MADQISIALFGTVVGGVVGFITKTYLTNLSFRQKSIESIVNRYLDVRDKLCELLAEFASKDLKHDKEWINEKRDEISKLYYTYYDYIPKQVLQELMCFQVCLSHRHHKIFIVEEDEIRPLEEHKIRNFVDQISVLKNIPHPLYLNLIYGTEEFKSQHRIQYQARHVLSKINIYFTEKNLTSLALFRPKNSA